MPPIVNVKAVVGIVAPVVVMTNDVDVVGLHVAFRAETLLLPAATIGVTDVAKKSNGKRIVMVEGGGRDVDGVKPMVMDTGDFPATLSEFPIANDGDVTKN
jgi:hypothetical protein